MMKRRVTGTKELAQTHTTSMRYNWDSNPGWPYPTVPAPSSTLHRPGPGEGGGVGALECDGEPFTALGVSGLWQRCLSFTECPRALHSSLSPTVHVTNSGQEAMDRTNGVTSGQSKGGWVHVP